MRAAGNWRTPRGEEPNAPRKRGGQVKRLFREAGKALAGPAPAPQPKPRRRRTGDTGRAFRMAARHLTRRNPLAALLRNLAHAVWHALDWMHLWNWNSPDGASGKLDEDFHSAAPNYLFPHL